MQIVGVLFLQSRDDLYFLLWNWLMWTGKRRGCKLTLWSLRWVMGWQKGIQLWNESADGVLQGTSKKTKEL